MRRLLSLPWRTLTIAAAALAVAAIPGAAGALNLDRAATLSGEPWRVITGHLVHGSSYHLQWNLLGLLGLGILFERDLGRRFWTLLAVSALTVGVGMLVLQPALPAYVGLSGVLNGLLFGGALQQARLERERGNRLMPMLYFACLVGDLMKISVEALIGAPILTDGGSLGGVAVPLAHALGAFAGVLAYRLAISSKTSAWQCSDPQGQPRSKPARLAWTSSVR